MSELVGKAATVRDTFYEQGDKVTIVLYAKDAKRDTVEVLLRDNVLKVSCVMSDDSVFTKTIELFASVDAYDSTDLPIVDGFIKLSPNINPFKIEIILRKKVIETWSQMTATTTKNPDIQARSNEYRDPVVHNQTHNWGDIEKQTETDDDGNLNSLLQKIFSNGNEETRRAMMKSFQTSGGTVLSTNWDEVNKTDYSKDIKAPDGTEFKKWKDM